MKKNKQKKPSLFANERITLINTKCYQKLITFALDSSSVTVSKENL